MAPHGCRPQLLLLLLLRQCGAARQKVLFIGNSYTFYNGGVWEMYKNIANTCVPGLQVTVASDTVGGRTLSQAAADSGVQSKVRALDYDIIVLQDQSVRGGLPASSKSRGYSRDAITDLFAKQAAKAHARVGLYQTWGRRCGHSGLSSYPELYDKWSTFHGMLDDVIDGYNRYAAVSEAAGAETVIARGGEAFNKVYTATGSNCNAHSFKSLYTYDNSHPDTPGTNLVAWTMVWAFNKDRLGPGTCDPANVWAYAGQSLAQKAAFRGIACYLAGLCASVEGGSLAPPAVTATCPARVTEIDDQLECADGVKCMGGGGGDWSCCSGHGGRAKCPPNKPNMCAKADGCASKSDHCCKEDCAEHDGDLTCPDTSAKCYACDEESGTCDFVACSGVGVFADESSCTSHCSPHAPPPINPPPVPAGPPLGDCPWRTRPTSELEENQLQCFNGELCMGGQEGDWSCCNGKGGRARCPPNKPLLCIDKKCAITTANPDGDHCCKTSCASHGGEKQCPTGVVNPPPVAPPPVAPLPPVTPPAPPAAAVCPWSAPSDEDDVLVCGNGDKCTGWSCCNTRGMRAQCPKNKPLMCAKENACASKSDFCCKADCGNDGVRPCTAGECDPGGSTWGTEACKEGDDGRHACYTCGARIKWMWEHGGYSLNEAMYKVGTESFDGGQDCYSCRDGCHGELKNKVSSFAALRGAAAEEGGTTYLPVTAGVGGLLLGVCVGVAATVMRRGSQGRGGPTGNTGAEMEDAPHLVVAAGQAASSKSAGQIMAEYEDVDQHVERSFHSSISNKSLGRQESTRSSRGRSPRKAAHSHGPKRATPQEKQCHI